MIVEETVVIAADHPALAGHFPGRPVVPGAVLLDHGLALARRSGATRIAAIAAAKFAAPLAPGVPCLMRLSTGRDGTLRLSCEADGATILTAVLTVGREAGSDER